MFQYYDFQYNAINKAIESIYENKNLLISAPTGTGKTIIEIGLLLKLNELGISTCIISKRNEILWGFEDIATNLFNVPSISHYLWTPLTLQNAVERNRAKLPKVVIVDECHHLHAPTWELFKDSCVLIGLTASPLRQDNEENIGWKNIFKNFYSCISIVEAIKKNILVPFYIPQDYLCKIKREGNEAEESKTVQKISSKYIKNNIANIFQEIAKIDDKEKRSTLICVPNNNVGHFLTNYFNLHGINCMLVDGNVTKDERIKALNSLKENKSMVLTVDILIEGIDIPELSRIVNLRLMNTIQYVQLIGRGLRIVRNNTNFKKIDCEIIDYTDTPIFYKNELKKYLGLSLKPASFKEKNFYIPDFSIVENVVNNYKSINFTKINNYSDIDIYLENKDYNFNLSIIETQNFEKKWLLKIKENNYLKCCFLKKTKDTNKENKFAFVEMEIATFKTSRFQDNIDYKLNSNLSANFNKYIIDKIRQYNIKNLTVLSIFTIAFIESLKNISLKNKKSFSIINNKEKHIELLSEWEFWLNFIPNPEELSNLHFK